MAHFGRFLANWVAHRGLSVPDLSRMSDVSVRTLWRALKSDQPSLQRRNLAAVAHVLGVSINEFDEAWRQEQAGVFPGYGDVQRIGTVGQWIPIIDVADVRGALIEFEHESAERFAAAMHVRDPAALAFRADDSMAGIVQEGDMVFVEPLRLSSLRHQWRDMVQGRLGLIESRTKTGFVRCFGLIAVRGDHLLAVRSNPKYGPGFFPAEDLQLEIWLATCIQRDLRYSEPQMDGPVVLRNR